MHLFWLHPIRWNKRSKVAEYEQLITSKGLQRYAASYLQWVRTPVCHAPHATAWCGGSSASPPTMPYRGLSGRECSYPGWYAANGEGMKTRSVSLKRKQNSSRHKRQGFSYSIKVARVGNRSRQKSDNLLSSIQRVIKAMLFSSFKDTALENIFSISKQMFSCYIIKTN